MAIIWNEKPIGIKPQPTTKVIDATETINVGEPSTGLVWRAAPKPTLWQRIKEAVEPVTELFTGLTARERQLPEYGTTVRLPFQKEPTTLPISPTVGPGTLAGTAVSAIGRIAEWPMQVGFKAAQDVRDVFSLINKGEFAPPYPAEKAPFDLRRIGVDDSKQLTGTMKQTWDRYQELEQEKPSASYLESFGKATRAYYEKMAAPVADYLIMSDILRAGAQEVLEGTAKSVSKNQAWQTLGMPETKEEAHATYLELAHKFHPDMPTGNEIVFKNVNDAWQIINKEGIPSVVERKAVPTLRQFAQKVVSPFKIPAEERVAFPGVAGELPGIAPAPGEPAFAPGMTIRKMVPVGRVPAEKGIIPKEFEAIAQKAKSAEEFISKIRSKIDISFTKEKPSSPLLENIFKTLSPEEQQRLFTRMPSRRVYDKWLKKTAIEDMALNPEARLITKELPTTKLLEKGKEIPVLNISGNNIPLSETEFKYYQMIKSQLIDIYAQATKSISQPAGEGKPIPKELEPLAEEARKYKSAEEFFRAGDTNFIIERYRRVLNRNDRRLSPNDFGGENRVTLWRTSDKPIQVGDYVYTSLEEAQRALKAGQGKKLFSKNVFADEVIEAGPGGEFFYGPRNLKKYNGIEDLWREANNLPLETRTKVVKSLADIGKMEIEALKRNMEFGKEEFLRNSITKDIAKEYNLTKSQLTDFYTQATKGIPKVKPEVKPLAQSISKAKASGQSFDEWVKGQGNVLYRATDSKSGYAELGNGIYGADKPEFAKLFGKNIEELVVDPKAKIIIEGSPEFESLYRAATPRGDYKMNPELARKTALARGIDGIKGLDPDTGTVIFNDKMFKTRSQLRAEWDKVEATKGIKAVKGEKGAFKIPVTGEEFVAQEAKFYYRGINKKAFDKWGKEALKGGTSLDASDWTTNLDIAKKYAGTDGKVYMLNSDEVKLGKFSRMETMPGISEPYFKAKISEADLIKAKEIKAVKPEVLTKPPAPPKIITPTTELPKAPEDPYKRELLEEIEKLPTLPKIESDVLNWKPPTLGYQNPYTKKAYQVWDKFNDAFTRKAPDALKTFSSKEIKELALEKQRVIDGLTKKYTEEFIKPLEKLSVEEKQKIGQMVFKYIPVEPGYKPLIKNIDLHIGQLGKALIDIDKRLVTEGKLKLDMALLSEGTWFRNLGQYMRTLYVRPPKIPGEKMQIVPKRTFSAEGIIDRSAFKRKLTDMEWGLNSLQFEGRSLDEIKDLFNTNPKQIEEIGREAKKAWGWRTEADFALARTFKDMVNTYATRLWQEAVTKSPELFSKTFKEGFVSVKSLLGKGVEKDVRLGPLNYGYINPGLRDEIRMMITHGSNAVEKILGEPLSWWKAFKVAGNPATVARNYLSGAFIQTDMAGYPVWNPRNTGQYISAVKDYITKSPFYKKLRDGGMYGSDYYVMEIEKSLMQEIERSANPAETLAKRLLEKLGDGIKDSKKLFSYYGEIDHLQRTYLAKTAMRDGATLPQAIHFANKWELDYRFVPKIIATMRGPIGGWIAPFISFYSLMAPRILETVATRPWVLLKYPIIIAALGYLSRQVLGYIKEQAETAKPNFLKNDPYTILTPFTDENGNPIYINLTYTLPFGGWQTAFIDIPAIGNMVQSMGLAGGIQAVSNNYDPFTQRKIFNDGDLPEEKRKKIAMYIMRFVSPGVVPQALNIWDATQGKVTGWPYPREKDLTQVLLRSMGISTYTGGYNEAIMKIRTYDQEIKDIQMALASTLRNVNISPTEKQQKIIEARKEIQNRIDKIQKIGKSMPPVPKSQAIPQTPGIPSSTNKSGIIWK